MQIYKNIHPESKSGVYLGARQAPIGAILAVPDNRTCGMCDRTGPGFVGGGPVGHPTSVYLHESGAQKPEWKKSIRKMNHLILNFVKD